MFNFQKIDNQKVIKYFENVKTKNKPTKKVNPHSEYVTSYTTHYYDGINGDSLTNREVQALKQILIDHNFKIENHNKTLKYLRISKFYI